MSPPWSLSAKKADRIHSLAVSRHVWMIQGGKTAFGVPSFLCKKFIPTTVELDVFFSVLFSSWAYAVVYWDTMFLTEIHSLLVPGPPLPPEEDGNGKTHIHALIPLTYSAIWRLGHENPTGRTWLFVFPPVPRLLVAVPAVLVVVAGIMHTHVYWARRYLTTYLQKKKISIATREIAVDGLCCRKEKKKEIWEGENERKHSRDL